VQKRMTTDEALVALLQFYRSIMTAPVAAGA
jgi:hypothetical protein